jgi:hypothetical protein
LDFSNSANTLFEAIAENVRNYRSIQIKYRKAFNMLFLLSSSAICQTVEQIEYLGKGEIDLDLEWRFLAASSTRDFPLRAWRDGARERGQRASARWRA